MNAPPIELLVLSAPADTPLRDELMTHLAGLKRQGLVSTWHDGLIAAGTERASTVQQRLGTASVIVPLISADFIANDECFEYQSIARARVTAEGVVLLPVIVRACDWRALEFEQLEVLPDIAKAVASWTNRDEAWHNVVVGVRDAIQRVARQVAVKPPREEHDEAGRLRTSPVIVERGILEHRETIDQQWTILLETATRIVTAMAHFNSQTHTINSCLKSLSEEDVADMPNTERLRLTNHFTNGMVEMKNVLSEQVPKFSLSSQEIFGAMSGITHFLSGTSPSLETLKSNAALLESYRDQFGETAAALGQYRDSFGLLPELTSELAVARLEAMNILTQFVETLFHAQNAAQDILSRTHALLSTTA
ncbi:hypothetical protein BE08_41620 [Sorangium cellulosum]|uniref:TIR domain-containing protein n=1 Tax=Sorangium cellulosum TaxID=56 RepID=A0A150PEX7_SORCE|nr:hypothetical protein BE08_41620 [Sorangium cellulosum]